MRAFPPYVQPGFLVDRGRLHTKVQQLPDRVNFRVSLMHVVIPVIGLGIIGVVAANFIAPAASGHPIILGISGLVLISALAAITGTWAEMRWALKNRNLLVVYDDPSQASQTNTFAAQDVKTIELRENFLRNNDDNVYIQMWLHLTDGETRLLVHMADRSDWSRIQALANTLAGRWGSAVLLNVSFQ